MAVGGLTQFRAWSHVEVRVRVLRVAGTRLATGPIPPRPPRRKSSARASAPPRFILLVGLVDQIPVGVRPPFATTRASLDSARGFTAARCRPPCPTAPWSSSTPSRPFPRPGRRGPCRTTASPCRTSSVTAPCATATGGSGVGKPTGRGGGRSNQCRSSFVAWPRPGSNAVMVDRRAYLGNGAVFERSLAATLGPATGTSRDGEQSWFDLRPLRASMARELPRAEITQAGRLITHGIDPSFSGEVATQPRRIGPPGPLDRRRRTNHVHGTHST